MNTQDNQNTQTPEAAIQNPLNEFARERLGRIEIDALRMKAGLQDANGHGGSLPMLAVRKALA